MIRHTVERVEVDQHEKDATEFDCAPCDATGKQTKREGEQIWRFPVPCLSCNGSGVNLTLLKERADWLLSGDRFTTGERYRKVIAALLRAAFRS